MSEQPDHLADHLATPTAGAMGDAADGMTAALQRHYAVPSGNAPFLTFDAIARRVAATSGATDDSAQFAALAADELAAADEWAEPAVDDDATRIREKEMTMTPYDTGNTLPPPPAIASGYSPRAAASDVAARRTPDAATYRPGDSGAVERASRPPVQRRRYTQGLIAVAAAILIVGLLGAVLYNFGFSHRNSPTGKHATPVVHYLGARAKWQIVGQFADDQSKATIAYFVTQSNPMIVYRYNYNTNNFVLERSSDAGATWQDLALPQQDFPGVTPHDVTLTISPVNPQILILLLGSDQNNPDCPAYVNAGVPGTDNAVRHARSGQAGAHSATSRLAASIPASGGYSCSFQYVSSDGGASWSKLQLPGGEKLWTLSLQTSVDASGGGASSRLYSLAAPDTNGFAPLGWRLMVSADGGATWTFADAPLIAQGVTPLSAAESQTGATVFADTVPVGLNSGNSQAENSAPHEFWRSDDAGAHWTDLGKSPSLDKYGELGQLTATQVGGKTLLYSQIDNVVFNAPAEMPFGIAGASPDSIFVSADSGRTWRHAPKSGVPAGLNTINSALGTLSNGAIVYPFSTEHERQLSGTPGSSGSFTTIVDGVTYYSWNPATSNWNALTSHLVGDNVYAEWLTAAQAGQPETIWALVIRGATLYLEKCALS